MNWLLLVVCAVLLISIIDGYRKGFVRILVSLLTLVLTIFLVGVVNPYISDFLINKTPLYDSINNKVINMLENQGSNEQNENDSLSQGNEMSDWNSEGNQVVEGGTGTGNDGTNQVGIFDGNGNQITAEYQTEAIKGFALPAIIKDGLIKNNNEAQYSILKATNFYDYVGKYITRMIIKVLSFFITFLLITLVLRMTFFTLDTIANLPVIRGVNKLAGIAMGLVQGILIIWIGFFVIVFFAGNEFSTMLYAQIDANPFLRILFDYNLVLNYVLKKSL